MVSMTGSLEDLRLKMEPRTVTSKNILKIIEQPNKSEIHTGIMTEHIIHRLNTNVLGN